MSLPVVLRRLRTRLGQPVDGSSIAVFRICFGALLAYEIWFKLRIEKHKELNAPIHFGYQLFEWLPRPASDTQSLLLHWVLILLSLTVAAGFLFRVSAALLCLLLSSYLLMEKALYINHIYLYCLLAGLLSCGVAHNMLSVDAWLKHRLTRPSLIGAVPLHNLVLLRFQASVVYVFAGIAKLNSDWLSGVPLNLWLPAKAGASIWGELLNSPALPQLIAIGGLAFDLCIVPLLLYSKTRWAGFGLACMFHLLNATIFGIASFPWMGIILSSLFFESDWPRRLLGAIRRLVPAVGYLERFNSTQISALVDQSLRPWTAILVGLYCLIQVLLPLRHVLYPGPVAWTEEGHRFSWRMMLRTKSGSAMFVLRNPATGDSTEIDPADRLTRRQYRAMVAKPDMLQQFALHLADEQEQLGNPRPEVFVRSSVSLNGRARTPLVSREQDLAATVLSLMPAKWLLPPAKRTN